MKNVVYNQIKAHIKDGLLDTAAKLLREQERDIRYSELFCLLQIQALRMVQSIGPLSQSTYLEIITLTFPNLKGGVLNE